MPRGHFIKPNDRCERLQHAIWFDTETDQTHLDLYKVGHVLNQGWAAYSRRLTNGAWSEPEWFRFTHLHAFWDWVEAHARPKTKLYVFCHNTNFDLPVVDTFKQVPERGWAPNRLVIEAPPTIIRVRKNTSTIQILDTLNWWTVPLAKLGESIGLSKLTMPTKGASREEWDTYNKRDVEIIMRAVQHWADLVYTNDLGGFQPTLAGQSYNAWRHRFMQHRVLIDTHSEALACSRASYHGGRTEAFYIGELRKVVHLLDINSMYPAVMGTERFPTVLEHFTARGTPSKLRYLLSKYSCCAHVRVQIDHPALGIKQNDRFIFPTGEFDAHLSTPELKYIQKHGKILKVYEIAAYAHAPLFREFVRYMYAWRTRAKEQGNEVESFLVKILMNSLYGKFGQRGIRYEEAYKVNNLDLDKWTEVNHDTKEQTHYRQLMGVVQRMEKESESSNSHPAIAAHVTAYARMLLWRYMSMAGMDHVYYCDTDSLLVDDIGLERLRQHIDPIKLGYLKHEGTYNDCDIRGAKDYRFGDTSKVKGVRKSAAWLGGNTVQQEKWSGLRGLLRSGRLDQPTTDLIEKNLRRSYDKARVLPGGLVVPWVLGDD